MDRLTALLCIGNKESFALPTENFGNIYASYDEHHVYKVKFVCKDKQQAETVNKALKAATADDDYSPYYKRPLTYEILYKKPGPLKSKHLVRIINWGRIK